MSARCEDAFPVKDAFVGMWLLAHDFIDRVNGLTYEDSIWKRDDGSEWADKLLCHCGCGKINTVGGQAFSIVLSGKRIPPMPGMTKYLVAHEYGHAVFGYIARKLGYEHDVLYDAYMAARDVPETAYTKSYGGGKWHKSPGEIAANDFRILFAEQETEFWPHEVARPSWDHEGLRRWWMKACEICGIPQSRGSCRV